MLHETGIINLFISILFEYNWVQNGENIISSKYIFHLIFHWKQWKVIYYGLLYHKTFLGILKPLKTAKNVHF